VIGRSESLLPDDVVRESLILEGPLISISPISSISPGKSRAPISLFISTILISSSERESGLGLGFRVEVELIRGTRVYYRRLTTTFAVYSYISFQCLSSSASL
jgi:hypothetical protein